MDDFADNLIGDEIFYRESMRLMKDKTYHIIRSSSPWSGLTGTWDEEQRGMHIIARDFPDGDFKPWEPLLDYSVGGMPLLFRSETRKEVSVNSDYFSDLDRIDATKLDPDKMKILGLCKKLPPSGVDFIVDFLIQSQIIITLRHVESNLNLVKLSENDVSKSYTFTGEHVYYTSKMYREPLSFTVEIWINGDIRIGGDY